MKNFKTKHIFAGIIFTIILSFSNLQIAQAATNDLTIHFIDVGQGDAILVKQGDKEMAIDGGENNKANEAKLKSYYDSLGIDNIEYVVGTHAHSDHIGSLDYLINTYNVGEIFFPTLGYTPTTKAYKSFMTSIQNKGKQAIAPQVGSSVMVGDAKCTILAPNSNKYSEENDYSIVIKVEYGSNSFLLMGDAQETSEKEILNNGANVKSDLIKIGHHGSETSTSDEFLNSVNPKYAVISCGANNTYNHPRLSITSKLKERNVALYRTDENGTVVADSDGKNITFNTSQGDYKGYANSKATSMVEPTKPVTETPTNTNTNNKPADNTPVSNLTNNESNKPSENTESNTKPSDSNTSKTQTSTMTPELPPKNDNTTNTTHTGDNSNIGISVLLFSSIAIMYVLNKKKIIS